MPTAPRRASRPLAAAECHRRSDGAIKLDVPAYSDAILGGDRIFEPRSNSTTGRNSNDEHKHKKNHEQLADQHIATPHHHSTDYQGLGTVKATAAVVFECQ